MVQTIDIPSKVLKNYVRTILQQFLRIYKFSKHDLYLIFNLHRHATNRACFIKNFS
jgi:hypothetical protein